MNREKRKLTLKILNSGHAAINIYSQIAVLFEVPPIDIERIINNLGWDRKHILTTLDYFPQAKKGVVR